MYLQNPFAFLIKFSKILAIFQLFSSGVKWKWVKLIDFDWNIIYNADIACTNFKYFEGIEKYQSEISIPDIGI